MDCRAIHPGDLVEVQINGYSFQAVVKSKQPRSIGIEPVDPIRFSWRHCSSRQVKRRIERPISGAGDEATKVMAGAPGEGEEL